MPLSLLLWMTTNPDKSLALCLPLLLLLTPPSITASLSVSVLYVISFSLFVFQFFISFKARHRKAWRRFKVMPGFIRAFLSLGKGGWDQEGDTRGQFSYTAIPYLNTLRKTKKSLDYLGGPSVIKLTRVPENDLVPSLHLPVIQEWHYIQILKHDYLCMFNWRSGITVHHIHLLNKTCVCLWQMRNMLHILSLLRVSVFILYTCDTASSHAYNRLYMRWCIVCQEICGGLVELHRFQRACVCVCRGLLIFLPPKLFFTVFFLAEKSISCCFGWGLWAGN